jgi:hypothetical protein
MNSRRRIPHLPKPFYGVRAYFAEAGFDVVRLKGLKCATPRLIAQVPLQDIRNSLPELDGDGVDALLMLGTALPAASVAVEAERWLGKPVLAVNVGCQCGAARVKTLPAVRSSSLAGASRAPGHGLDRDNEGATGSTVRVEGGGAIA